VVTVKDLSADERVALDVLQVIGVWQKREDVAAVASESLARALDEHEPRTLRRAS
jgi:hypothetical protein